MTDSFQKKIQIGKKWIGKGYPCFVIAEAGSNHNGELSKALQLIDLAVSAGADAIKFQTFSAEHLYPNIEKSAEYLKELGIKKNVFQVIKELEMPLSWIPILASYCEKKDIIFLSTPFDERAADKLESYVPAFKIASYEMTHSPLIDYVARKFKPVLISTGGATFEEIEEMINLFQLTGNRSLCLLQCTAKYPAPLDSLNIDVISTFSKCWNVPVGLSDHSLEFDIGPLLAVAKGANVIEKHFTLSRALPGPDHTYALEPMELKSMVDLIRTAERCIGSGVKVPHMIEHELRNYRRGIFSITNISAGEVLNLNNIAILRRSGLPETDLNPREFSEIVGKSASRELKPFTLMSKIDVNF